MSDEHEDDRLRERFRELRAHAQPPGRAPELGAMLARARAEAAAGPDLGVVRGGARRAGGWSVRRYARAGAWATAALAATVAALLLTDRRPNPEAEFEQLVAAYAAGAPGTTWQSPTSRLLDVPGMELTRSMPSIGSPVRGLDPSSLPPLDAVPEERS